MILVLIDQSRRSWKHILDVLNFRFIRRCNCVGVTQGEGGRGMAILLAMARLPMTGPKRRPTDARLMWVGDWR